MHSRSDVQGVSHLDAVQTAPFVQSALLRHSTQRPCPLLQTRLAPQSSELLQGVNATQRWSEQSLFAGQSAAVLHSTQRP